MKKRTFSAEFKTKVVLEAIRGEKEINELASEHQIAPNLIRNWKKEFINNASSVFDTKKDDDMLVKLKEAESDKDDLTRKVGQLTMQVDWLKKNLKNVLGLTGRVNLLRDLKDSNDEKISVKTAAELLDVNRTSVYYKGLPVSRLELEAKAIIDRKPYRASGMGFQTAL